ncbi:MAG: bifunctional phosphoglucose/phosphomannose isomerase [Candidatus Bathyarchaeota archaeon]|nr:MAG: bifunctional phosphoglucose/phosphomannose isomerase [Candidatus Bathyarchaeota archaeon]
MATLVLDYMDKIKKIDSSNMLSFCVDVAKHYREAAKITEKISLRYSKPENIIVAGMGGSGIGGEMLKDWARDKAQVPIEVSRGYVLPAYANEKSLVLVVSYSGETEESLGAFLDAAKRRCMRLCVSSGGSLQKFAEKLKVPYLHIPSGMPPRAALPDLFTPLLKSLEKMKIVSGVFEDLSEAKKILERISDENAPEKPTCKNLSKTLALGIDESVPVVYGFDIYRSVAQRFKQQFNENSKVLSKWEFFPELNHNEIVGWEKAGKLARCFSTIFIRDKSESNELRSRIETTKTLMHPDSKMFEVWSQGNSSLARMLSCICIGDFTSVYLAILRNVDPTPVNAIVLLKEKMKQSRTKEKIIRELKRITAK